MIGPDAFTIRPVDGTLRLTTESGRNPSGQLPTVLSDMARSGTALKPKQPEWRTVGMKPTPSGESSLWEHIDTGMRMGVMDGVNILWVSGNASKLCFGSTHNGRAVRTQQEFDDALTVVEGVLRSILSDNVRWRFTFSMIEFGGVVEQPYENFASLLRGRNYPGLKKAQMTGSDSSLRFGTGKKSPFALTIYDKGLQMKNVYHLREMRAGRYTRIEFKLKDRKITKHFGGNTRQHVTHQKMVALFFPLLFRLDPNDDAYLTDFPGTKAGLLARSLLPRGTTTGGEDAVDWFLRVSSGKRAAKDLVRKAQHMVMRHRGMAFKQLVPVDSPYIDLDGTVSPRRRTQPKRFQKTVRFPAEVD